MRILMINVVCGIRSTGRICTDLAKDLESQGHEVKIAYGRGDVPERFQRYAVRVGNEMDVKLHAFKARIFDAAGLGSKRATERFLEWAEEYNPDFLWLHNVHGYYINIVMLFKWIKTRPDMKVKWTLHDCWAFTGHCTYFTMARCDRWRTECGNCPQQRSYPASYFFDKSRRNFALKKSLFTGIYNLSLITPSQWLANLIRDSFLKDYPVEVVYNTIDTSVFKPTPSDFRKKYHIEDKIIVLGVASVWEKRKGLDDFYKLAQMLDHNYVIVLVGLNDRQIKKIPNKIKGIKCTNNTEELAAIYSGADIFVNPSQEETFGMTTLEALSCGTHAIVYKGTACEEITNDNNGIVVPVGVDHLYKAITGRKYEKSGGG